MGTSEFIYKSGENFEYETGELKIRKKYTHYYYIENMNNYVWFCVILNKIILEMYYETKIKGRSQE